MDARNFQYLVYGLTAAWLILMLYVLWLARREGSIRQEMARLREMLAGKEQSR